MGLIEVFGGVFLLVVGYFILRSRRAAQEEMRVWRNNGVRDSAPKFQTLRSVTIFRFGRVGQKEKATVAGAELIKRHRSLRFWLTPGVLRPASAPPRVLGLLSAFMCFCGKEDREMVTVIQDDLKRDASQMRREGHGKIFIQLRLLKQILLGTIAPICWEGALKAVGKVWDAARARF